MRSQSTNTGAAVTPLPPPACRILPPSASSLLRTPHWADLMALLDAVCVEQGFFKRNGQPRYDQLARACGINPSALQGWRRHQQRPSRALLGKVAAYAGQPLEPWLAAAGPATEEERAP